MEALKRLLNAFGPSGSEDEIANLIIEEIKGYADEIKTDRLGNVIAVKKGSGDLKMMVAAHMDQIGVMVTEIDKNGYLRFIDVGYVDPISALFHNVIFKNGVTGTIAYETKKEAKDIKIANLYIDIGASNKEEAAKKVKIGDYGVFKTDFAVNEDRVTSAALDDRIGCYILIEALKKIKNPAANIYFVFTVQEESYISGAATSAYAIEPDCAVVVDVTDTGDTPNCRRMAVKLGEGAAIKVMDRGMICHPKMKAFIEDTAKKYNIKHQFEVLEVGGTDGAEIHVSRSGVMTGAISVPTRYIHTPQEVIDIKDINASTELLVKVIEEYK